MLKTLLPIFLFSCSLYVVGESGELKLPSVFISILVRNKAHVLPYFLTQLENLSYPKSRIIVYIKSDHNQDKSLEILRRWVNHISPSKLYHDIITDFQDCEGELCLLEDEEKPVGWYDEKFSRMMGLREKSLELARFSLADYYWALDADVLLTNPDVLEDLISADKTVVAPMLPSVGLYSNFWAGMSDTYYYQRTDDYKTILERRKNLGCHPVPMVHSSVLVNLRAVESDIITYLPHKIDGYPGPHDDIIVFALSCQLNSIPLHVCNQAEYGLVMTPLEDHQELEDDLINLKNTLVELTVKNEPIKPLPLFEDLMPTFPPVAMNGLDEIYMINLDRRPDRRLKMEFNFQQLGLEYRRVEAVDGKLLDKDYLESNGISMLKGFSEPYHGRALTFGEIGCFMSHYNIWKDIVDNDYSRVLVLEDDIRFEAYFVEKLNFLLEELDAREDEWDLVFLGRKISANADEPWVEGSEQLVHVDYSYWTLAYILSGRGAAKLLRGAPLSKMLPVDEYLPIMYDRHPNTTWKSAFHPRDLSAWSVAPLLVYPTHYTGEEGYISDTEWTDVILHNKTEVNCDGVQGRGPGCPLDALSPASKDEF